VPTFAAWPAAQIVNVFAATPAPAPDPEPNLTRPLGWRGRSRHRHHLKSPGNEGWFGSMVAAIYNCILDCAVNLVAYQIAGPIAMFVQ
jgi:hypothetical protein